MEYLTVNLSMEGVNDVCYFIPLELGMVAASAKKQCALQTIKQLQIVKNRKQLFFVQSKVSLRMLIYRWTTEPCG